MGTEARRSAAPGGELPSPGSSRAVLLATALLLLAALTAVVVAVDGPLPGEVAYIHAWQRLGQPVPVAADLVRAVTGTEGNLIAGAVASIWLVRHRPDRRALGAVMIVATAMLVVQPVSKELVDRDRPSPAQVEVRAEPTSRSYPSGHSLSTTAVWGTAALLAWRAGRSRRASVLAVPIVCTGFASAIQGVHWASDAIAGTIMGGVAAWLAAELLRPGRSRTDHSAEP